MSEIQFHSSDTSGSSGESIRANIRTEAVNTDGSDVQMVFQIKGDVAGNPSDAMIIKSNKDVETKGGLSVDGNFYIDGTSTFNDDTQFDGDMTSTATIYGDIIKVTDRVGGAAVKGAFFDANNQLIEGDIVTGGKFVDGTDTNDAVYMDGDVGIGITNPNHKLQVYEETNLGSNAGDTNDMFSLKSETSNSDFLNFTTRRNVAGSNWETAKHRIQRKVDNTLMGYMQFGSPFGTYNDMITFGSNDTELFKIRNDGIVETGPSVRVRASSTEAASIEIGQGRTGNGFSYLDFIGNTTYNDFGLRLSLDGSNGFAILQHRGTSGALFIRTSEAAPITFQTTSAERMRITADGKVGILTNNPSAELDLVGDAEINGDLEVTGGIEADGDLGAAGELNITGDATFSETVTIENRSGTATKSAFFDTSGKLVEGDIVSGAYIGYGGLESNFQTISSTSATKVQFNASYGSTNTTPSTASNRITIDSSGYWQVLVTGNVINYTIDEVIKVDIRVNGTSTETININAISTTFGINYVEMLNLSSDDYVEVFLDSVTDADYDYNDIKLILNRLSNN